MGDSLTETDSDMHALNYSDFLTFALTCLKSLQQARWIV